jgi:hypothetical protein
LEGDTDITSEEFRKDAERVKELRTVLTNPVLQQALLIIHDSRTIVDAPDNSDPLASVRKLSNLAGRADVITELYTLATPLGETKPLPRPTFGVEEKPPEGWSESLL